MCSVRLCLSLAHLVCVCLLLASPQAFLSVSLSLVLLLMLSYVVRVLVVNVVLWYLPVFFALLYILVGSIFFIIMCVCVSIACTSILITMRYTCIIS